MLVSESKNQSQACHSPVDYLSVFSCYIGQVRSVDWLGQEIFNGLNRGSNVKYIGPDQQEKTPGLSLIGVFHGVAGVARATPGFMELPSTSKGSEVSR